ncbi:hypothetical protein C1Y63_04800 [Corynebacterium sp. 13CS0277]|uniref:ADDT family thymidine hypermodification transferase n=1 Tax=Corynebacterium sp. 13CS0277 TaxID=2071994 RepID=UPI000D02FCBE|nr:hypothetical protein [Corynebacterium sp. 13CS0277]PRQ11730.1 hypothetical protein C1Y63_04800 [Corynebacterium sp. 13CS0277]
MPRTLPVHQTTEQRQADFVRWHRKQLAAGDSDPHYPVITGVGEALGSREHTAWLLLRHTGFYHMGSTLRSYAESPGPHLPDTHLAYPTGTERRNHRVPTRFRKHWTSLLHHIDNHGGPIQWLTPPHTGTRGWQEMMNRALAVWGNGRYFAYKVAEMSACCLGTPINAPDACHDGSSGPRKGLQDIYGPQPKDNTPETIRHLDALTEQLRAAAGQPDVARIETSLCNFHSAHKGRYYIGQEIDEQLEQLTAVPSPLTEVALNVRRNTFPHEYLGELHGRHTIDRARGRIYRDTGHMIERH